MNTGATSAAEDAVYCIACRTVYSKPTDGVACGAGAVCPTCGYAGWVALRVMQQQPCAPAPAPAVPTAPPAPAT